VRRRYRLLASLGLLVLSTFAVFAMLEAIPGGPAAAYAQNPSDAASEIARLDRELGTGRPFYVLYFAWIFHVLRGDLGWSPTNAEPVSTAIAERLPATIELVFFAFFAAVALGAIIGFVRARARAPILRGALAVTQLIGRSLPIIVLAMFLELLSAFTPVLPPAGFASGEAFDLSDRIRHLILPVLCLAVPFGAWASLIFYDFFRATDGTLRTSVRSVAGPLAMSAALIGPALLSASLFVEVIFAWPGVARLFYSGLSQFDPGMIAAFLLMYCAAFVVIDLVAHLAPGTPDGTLPQQPGSLQTSASGRKRINATVIVAIVVLLGAAFGALAANLIVPAGPNYIDQVHWQGYPLAPGVAGHALGTDENGRDLLSRVLVGLRTSLGIAALAALIATAIGFVVAMATKTMRRLDGRAALSVVGIRAFAGVPFVLAVVTVLIVRSHDRAHVLNPFVIALVIALVSWPAIVPAFRTLTSATLGAIVDLLACALLLEVTLSMIGVGVQPPTPSLGSLFMNAQSNITIAPWIPIVATVVVIIVLFALYAVGDDLRERGRLDPKGRAP